MTSESQRGLRRTITYPSITGFWTWDVKLDLVHGDANLFDYFALSVDEFARGTNLSRFLEAIVITDRDRVAASISRSVALKTGFRETYTVATTSHGLRTIMAVGHCYTDEAGEPAQYPGWFLDITNPVRFQQNALQVAADYVEHARDMAMASGQDFISYLLDNALEHIEEISNPPTDGKRRRPNA